jgi:uncharacterized protein YciI
MTAIPPIRREILVDTGPAAAFEIFTARIGRWWPLADKSVHGPGTSVAFDDGQLVERSAAGDVTIWGTVTRWEPAAAVAFTWHPGRTAETASHVEILFAAAGEQTLVTLTHAGWEVFADPAAARAEYDEGWPLVLDRYQDYAGRGGADGEMPGGGETWVALLHRPGAAAPDDGEVTDDPRFGEHLAFLNRMRAAGYLVAAGPLADAAGEGMTVLRLPGAGQLDRAAELATKDDASVAGGLLAVTVRPWQVVMTAG